MRISAFAFSYTLCVCVCPHLTTVSESMCACARQTLILGDDHLYVALLMDRSPLTDSSAFIQSSLLDCVVYQGAIALFLSFRQ